MYRGYVKLWRKSIESGWLQNHELWTFWCWCLMKASHKEHDHVVGYRQIHLMPGEFIFGRKKAAEELHTTERKIRTCLKTLLTMQNVTSKTTNKFSIISIANWDTYQGEEFLNDQQNANKRPASDQQVTTNKNVKNEKNKDIYARFETFYKAYPKKRSRGQAEKAWLKINPDEQLLASMIATIERAKKSEDWLKENGKYIPHPASWLNAKGWEDEIDMASVQTPKPKVSVSEWRYKHYPQEVADMIEISLDALKRGPEHKALEYIKQYTDDPEVSALLKSIGSITCAD